MMEASIEEGARAPLHTIPGEQELEDALQPLSRSLALRTRVFRALLVVDFVLVPLALIAGFDFNLGVLFSNQLSQFSMSSSLLDWVLLSMVRDISMVVFSFRGKSTAAEVDEAACGNMRVARRIAMGMLVYGIGRLSLLDWTKTRLLGAVILSCFLLLALSFLSIFVLRAMQHLIKERTRLSGSQIGEEADDSDAPQYSSKLTFWQTLRVMKPYFWPSTGDSKEVAMNRVRAISTWVCVAGSKSAGLLSPLFLARATNSISGVLQKRAPGVIPSIPPEVIQDLILYALFIFTAKVLKEVQELVYIKVQQAAYIEISEMSFTHLHTLSLDWHLRKKMGNVIRSMDRGIAAAQSTMKYCFLYLLPTLGEAGAVCMIFVLHFQNAQLAIFVLLNLYLYCYVTIKITTWRKKFRTATTKHDNELHDRLTDSLVNYETIKYFTAEEYERKEYRNVVTKFQKMSMATQASLSFLNILQQFIINFTLAGGLILATSRLMKGGDLGQFVAVNAYIVQTFAPLSFLGTIYNMVVNALVDMNSFGQLLAESPDVMDTPGAEVLDINQDAGCPIIEFRGVSFHYRKQPLERSIKDISFSTPRGSTTALVGTTGSGKTTITRLLFRFYDPLSGQVLINGRDARSITQKSLRMAMGFVPQDVVMFNASIEHNIKYGRIDGCSQEQVEIAAKQAQLGEFIDQQPQGYSTMVGERGLKLSGGEKQRLAIARCLLKNPPIVVLDEATSALDSQTEQKIQEALNFLSSARTVVAIAHRLSTIRQYDEVLVLEQGQILQRGSHDKLLAEEGGRYWQMWHRQASGIKDEADGPTQP